MTVLNKQFDAVLEKSPKKGGWTYVVMAPSCSASDWSGEATDVGR